MLPCPRCIGGQMIQSWYSGESGCLQCGYQPTRTPTAEEAAEQPLDNGEGRHKRRGREPFAGHKGYLYETCRWANNCLKCKLPVCYQTLSPPQQRRLDRAAKARQMQQEGKATTEIAVSVGRSSRQVYRLLQEVRDE